MRRRLAILRGGPCRPFWAAFVTLERRFYATCCGGNVFHGLACAQSPRPESFRLDRKFKAAAVIR